MPNEKIESKKLAKRLMVITSEFRTWKGSDGKDYDEAALKKAGLKTSDLCVVPMFASDDFQSPQTFSAAIPRVLKEWDDAKKYAVAITENPQVIEANNGSNELRIADATQGENALTFLHDIIKSGLSLSHQQTMGQALRGEAQKKLGSPKGTSSGRKRGLDA